jgi:hypothetical protein
VRTLRYLPVFLTLVALSGCGDDSNAEQSSAETETVPAESETDVFGVRIVSNGAPDAETAVIVETVRDLLDADDNGRADAPAVQEELASEGATIVAVPSSRPHAKYHQASATLELGARSAADGLSTTRQIESLLYRHGWSRVFDQVYGIRVGSDLAHAMDQARGGQFETVPDSYPAGAWFTQSREGCTYQCQLIEYFFHVHMTLRGEYEDEQACVALLGVWQTCTAEALRARDPLAYEAFTLREAGLAETNR